MEKSRNLVAIYARVSTKSQSVDSQLLPLRRYCEARGFQVYREYTDFGVSGSKTSRPQLNELMDDAKKRKFDALLVFKLDRFGRSTKHLITTIEELDRLGIIFISFSENIDLGSNTGRLIFHILSALSQFERDLIRERVMAGLEAAKEKGKILGRPKIIDADEIKKLRKQGLSFSQIARKLNIGKGSAHRLSVFHTKIPV